MSEDIRKMIDKVKNFKQFVNEQKLNENDKPSMMGTQYNQINILYKLTNDDFSYVPSNVNYWAINTDNTLINKITGYYSKDDEEKYQKAIKNKDFFFIYYNGKQYIYQRHYKKLYDKHENIVKSSEQTDVFNQQMNEIIHNTLNPTKTIDVF
jgi:hypothetical protein